jgi:dephospho-CoA kinase
VTALPGRDRRTVRIGLTGPIGCGKSTVAEWLAELGAATIDADEVAREVTATGLPATAAVLARFGEGIRLPDGGLDRPALARIVFSDPSALADLEAIVHPAVRARIVAEIVAAEADGSPAVVIEAIKLIEGGLAAVCDEVWLVTCEPAEQRSRLLSRGISEDDAERRIAVQGDIAGRVGAVARRVIDTSGSPFIARRSVEAAYRRACSGADPLDEDR